MSETETRSELSPRSLKRSPEPSADGLGGTGQGTEAPEKVSRFQSSLLIPAGIRRREKFCTIIFI